MLPGGCRGGDWRETEEPGEAAASVTIALPRTGACRSAGSRFCWPTRLGGTLHRRNDGVRTSPGSRVDALRPRTVQLRRAAPESRLTQSAGVAQDLHPYRAPCRRRLLRKRGRDNLARGPAHAIAAERGLWRAPRALHEGAGASLSPLCRRAATAHTTKKPKSADGLSVSACRGAFLLRRHISGRSYAICGIDADPHCVDLNDCVWFGTARRRRTRGKRSDLARDACARRFADQAASWTSSPSAPSWFSGRTGAMVLAKGELTGHRRDAVFDRVTMFATTLRPRDPGRSLRRPHQGRRGSALIQHRSMRPSAWPKALPGSAGTSPVRAQGRSAVLVRSLRLSERQQARLGRYTEVAGERAQELERRTCDTVQAAQAGVRASRHHGGPAAAARDRLGGGPLEIANGWARARTTAGEKRACSRHRPTPAEERKARSIARWACRAGGARGRAGSHTTSAFCASIEQAVHRDCERVGPNLRALLASLFASHRMVVGFAACAFPSNPPPLLGALEYFHDVCDLQRQTAPAGGLWQIAKNAWWMLPHRMCAGWRSGPTPFARTHEGRHCGDRTRRRAIPINGWPMRGRACWCRLGSSSVRSIVTVRTISAALDPQVRRCMIEDADARALHRRGRRLPRGAGRDRCAVASALALGGLGRRGGDQRLRPSRTAVSSAISCRCPPTCVRRARPWRGPIGLPEQRYRPVVRT